MAPEQFEAYPGLGRSFQDVTLRQQVVPSMGGTHFQVWLSNEFGTRPLFIGAAHLALSRAGSTIEPASDRALTFGGNATITIPAGAAVVSDIVELAASTGATLAVSTYLPGSTEGSPSSVHEKAWRKTYVSTRGNFAGSAAFPEEAELHSYFYLGGIDVEAPAGAFAIATLGDSITDGSGSTPGAGRAWPEVLARRLAAAGTQAPAVLNLGIGGNRLLHDRTGPSALARVNRDVLTIPGLRYLVVLEGINDIGGAEWFGRPEEDVSTEELIAALRQIIDGAHEHGIRVIGATLTPTGGSQYRGYDSALGDVKRQAVNRWIRESRAFDGVIDFDLAIRDPTMPSKIKREYDSGDHLHPSDAGYAAMAQAVDVDLLQRGCWHERPRIVHLRSVIPALRIGVGPPAAQAFHLNCTPRKLTDGDRTIEPLWPISGQSTYFS